MRENLAPFRAGPVTVTIRAADGTEMTIVGTFEDMTISAWSTRRETAESQARGGIRRLATYESVEPRMCVELRLDATQLVVPATAVE